MSRRPTRRTAAAIAAATALALTACTAPPHRDGTVSGTVTMRSVYGNGAGGVGADALLALLADTKAPVRLVDVTGDVVQEPTEDSDGDTIAALLENRADIAVVRVGRLAQAGADELLALQAPMVVTNDEQARKVAADETVLRTLDGLRRIDLVGIALVPGGVRHPFGYGSALASPDDFAGGVVNIRPDANTDAMMAALGATVDHSVGTERAARAGSGELRGIEVSFGQQAAVDLPAVVTSNVPLYQKFDVIVVRAKAYDALSAAQQAALGRHAVEAARRAVAARPTEEHGLSRWCSTAGASSIVASAAGLAAFRHRLDAVTETVAEDPDAAAVIDRMRALHAGTRDPAGATCDGSHAGAPVTLEPEGDQSVLDGIWRTEASHEEILAATSNAQWAGDSAGVWTVRIRNGIAELDQPIGGTCEGRFTIAGDQVLLDLDVAVDNLCGGGVKGTFVREGDRLRFLWTTDRDGAVALMQAVLGSLTRVTG